MNENRMNVAILLGHLVPPPEGLSAPQLGGSAVASCMALTIDDLPHGGWAAQGLHETAVMMSLPMTEIPRPLLEKAIELESARLVDSILDEVLGNGHPMPGGGLYIYPDDGYDYSVPPLAPAGQRVVQRRWVGEVAHREGLARLRAVRAYHRRNRKPVSV